MRQFAGRSADEGKAAAAAALCLTATTTLQQIGNYNNTKNTHVYAYLQRQGDVLHLMRIEVLRVNQLSRNMSEKSQTKEKIWFPVVISFEPFHAVLVSFFSFICARYKKSTSFLHFALVAERIKYLNLV